MKDAPVYSLDNLHIPGDGGDYDDPVRGAQHATGRVAGIGRWGWRDNAHGRADSGPRPFDLNIWIGNCPVDLTDDGADRDEDQGGLDTAADENAVAAMLPGGSGHALPLLDADTDADRGTVVHADTAARDVPSDASRWSLPAVLLADNPGKHRGE